MTFYLCECCSERVSSLDIHQHMVSHEHQYNYIVSGRSVNETDTVTQMCMVSRCGSFFCVPLEVHSNVPFCSHILAWYVVEMMTTIIQRCQFYSSILGSYPGGKINSAFWPVNEVTAFHGGYILVSLAFCLNGTKGRMQQSKNSSTNSDQSKQSSVR